MNFSPVRAADYSSSIRAIPFARDANGHWRSVAEVERGLQCGCRCPACDGPVVAKQGEVRVHHFAHHDRRECRHALEASLFGMTVTLLSEPGAVLQLPPAVSKRDWLPHPGQVLTADQQAKFFAEPWVIPARQQKLTGLEVLAPSLQESTPERPDLRSSDLTIHLLSHQKNGDGAPASGPCPILALDLRAYAKLWLQTCDAEKEEHLAEAAQAKETLRRWLSANIHGRYWLHQPEVADKRMQFDAWLARKAQARQEATEREHKEMRERTVRRAAENAPWVIPFREHTGGTNPEPRDAAPVNGRDRRLQPLEHLRRVLPETARWLTERQAADLGLYWDKVHATWVFVSCGGIAMGPEGLEFNPVPLKLRRFMVPDEPWEPVFPYDRQRLRAPQMPAAPAPPEISVAVAALKEPDDPEDEVIARLETTCCVCQAPLNHVRFRSGLFIGKQALQCSRYTRHPLQML